MISIKLKIESCSGDYSPYVKEYNSVTRFAFNRFKEGKAFKEIVDFAKTSLNNIAHLDVSMICYAVHKAEELFKTSPGKVIFGGRSNFFQRMKGLITREEFEAQKLLPLRIVGSKSDCGNRKFKLDLFNNRIIFTPNRKNHIASSFHETSRENRKLLNRLQALYDFDKCAIPFTIELNLNYLCLVFDESKLPKEMEYRPVSNRIAGIDLNPNYIALVVKQGKEILTKKVYSLKSLNDLDKRKNYQNKAEKQKYRQHLHSKRKYETIEISKSISSLCKHLKVETIIIEDLNIKGRNNGLGKFHNKSCNNDWLRNTFSNNLQKRCNLIGIKVEKVFAGYSSIKGQLENENEVDSIAAALEIANRHGKDLKNFGTRTVDLGKLANRWKKELISEYGENCILNWKQVSEFLKKKFSSSYRNFFSREKFKGVSFSLNSKKSYIEIYTFL